MLQERDLPRAGPRVVRGLTRFSLVSRDISCWTPNSTWASGESSRVWQKVCYCLSISSFRASSWVLRLSTSSSCSRLWVCSWASSNLHPEEGGQMMGGWSLRPQTGATERHATGGTAEQGHSSSSNCMRPTGDRHGARGGKRGRGAGQASRPAFLLQERESRSNTAPLTSGLTRHHSHPLILCS